MSLIICTTIISTIKTPTIERQIIHCMRAHRSIPGERHPTNLQRRESDSCSVAERQKVPPTPEIPKFLRYRELRLLWAGLRPGPALIILYMSRTTAFELLASSWSLVRRCSLQLSGRFDSRLWFLVLNSSVSRYVILDRVLIIPWSPLNQSYII